MLNQDQKQRVTLLRSMIECTKKEAIEALEKNYWDTSMAVGWLRKIRNNEEVDIEQFHSEYEEARKKSAALPQDRYDIPNSTKVIENRQARRAAKKKKKKK